LNSSGDTFGGSIRIGGVAIGDGFSLPSNVTISRSSLVADPPGLGGSISVTGSDISIYETQLNVVGLNGGAVNLGSAATGSLSLDKLTSLIGGGNAIFALIGNPVRNMASYKGGTLMVNGQVTSAPLDTTALPRLLVPKLFIFQESISPISLQKSASDATASTSETASPNQWMWLGESPLRVDLTSASWITDDSQLTPDPLQPVNIEQMGGIPLNIKPLAPDQVSATFEQSEQEAMDQTAVKLSLESDVSQAPPSVSDIQAILREVNEAMRRRLAGIRR